MFSGVVLGRVCMAWAGEIISVERGERNVVGESGGGSRREPGVLIK